MSAWAPPPIHPSAEREEVARRGVEAMGVKGIEAIGVLKTECQDNWVSQFVCFLSGLVCLFVRVVPLEY